MTDTYEPWENNWTPEETQHLEQMTSRMIEPIPLEEAVIVAEIEIPGEHLQTILDILVRTADKTEQIEEHQFFYQLGEAISLEYLESDIEWVDAIADLAGWFLPETEI